MIIGWAWEWPPPACGPPLYRPHEWARQSFTVSGYEPGVTRTVVWWMCRHCWRRRAERPKE